MNQPKFKFGDIVCTNKIPAQVFEVTGIQKEGETWAYRENGSWYIERSLEIYEEPKPKKLYAYWTLNGQYREVKFFENLIVQIGHTYDDLHRCEEFDLDYSRPDSVEART